MFFLLLASIVKACAKNSDDRRKVEKALEAVGFHAGKVSELFSVLSPGMSVLATK